MRKIKRTFEQGRPITGWAYGRLVTSVDQVKPGDVLIGDCHQFKATNLYRVVENSTGVKDLFHYIYITPQNRKADGDEMAAWHFELAPADTKPGSILRTSFYFAHRIVSPDREAAKEIARRSKTQRIIDYCRSRVRLNKDRQAGQGFLFEPETTGVLTA